MLNPYENKELLKQDQNYILYMYGTIISPDGTFQTLPDTVTNSLLPLAINVVAMELCNKKGQKLFVNHFNHHFTYINTLRAEPSAAFFYMKNLYEKNKFKDTSHLEWKV